MQLFARPSGGTRRTEDGGPGEAGGTRGSATHIGGGGAGATVQR